MRSTFIAEVVFSIAHVVKYDFYVAMECNMLLLYNTWFMNFFFTRRGGGRGWGGGGNIEQRREVCSNMKIEFLSRLVINRENAEKKIDSSIGGIWGWMIQMENKN